MIKKTKWIYNDELKMWFHPTGLTSTNPADKIPESPNMGEGENPGVNKQLKDCGCGKKGNRTSR